MAIKCYQTGPSMAATITGLPLLNIRSTDGATDVFKRRRSLSAPCLTGLDRQRSNNRSSESERGENDVCLGNKGLHLATENKLTLFEETNHVSGNCCGLQWPLVIRNVSGGTQGCRRVAAPVVAVEVAPLGGGCKGGSYRGGSCRGGTNRGGSCWGDSCTGGPQVVVVEVAPIEVVVVGVIAVEVAPTEVL